MLKKIISCILICSIHLAAYDIVVDIKNCKMKFYNNGSLISEYNVATIKPGLPIPNDGVITKVEMMPTWYPTEKTIEYFKNHKGINLPKSVPAGHPQNYMGSFKITMTNSTSSRGSVYRIHGNIDESTIGKRSSGGCVRMYNKEGTEFAKEIKNLLDAGEKIRVHYKS